MERLNYQAYTFLKIFFDRKRETDYIEIRCISGKNGDVRSFFYKKIDEINWNCLEKLNRKGYNIYFSVCPRKRKGGGKKDVSQILCLWADIDIKDGSDVGSVKEKTLRKLSFDLYPSVINFSGHGLQLFWLLEKVHQVTQKNIKDFESYCKYLQELLNGDPSVCELAHLMRVPGFLNVKDPDEPILSKTIEMNSKRVFSLSYFIKYKQHKDNSNIQHKGNSFYRSLCVGTFSETTVKSYAQVKEKVEKDWDVLFKFLRDKKIKIIDKKGDRENFLVRISCPFHPPDHHSSGSFKRGDKGDLIYHDFHDKSSYTIPEFAYFLKYRERMGKEARKKKYTEAVVDVAITVGVFTKSSFEKLTLAKKILEKIDELPLPTRTKNTLKTAHSIIAEVAVRFSFLDNHQDCFFLSCRELAEKMNKDVVASNRIINFLCTLGVLEKLPKGKGIRKADIFRLKDVSFNELRAKAKKLKDNGATLANFSRKQAAKVLPSEKVKKIFRRNGEVFLKSMGSDEKKRKAVAMAAGIFDGEVVEI